MSMINPRVDLVFKKLFGTIENKDLLISLINSVVSSADQVADVELLNPYNPQNFAGDKLSILDVKAKDMQGRYYNIEMQITDAVDYDKRALYYWAKLYTEQMREGMGYSELRKTIGIHILNFCSFSDSDKYHNKFHIENIESKDHAFKDFEMHTIELGKFDSNFNEETKNILNKVKTALDAWAIFLTRSYTLEKENLAKNFADPNIKKALSILDNMSLNTMERDFYDGHLKWLRDEASAIHKAELKNTAIIASNLLKANIDIKTISQATGLTEEELTKLKGGLNV